jgi:hypothetical protein
MTAHKPTKANLPVPNAQSKLPDLPGVPAFVRAIVERIDRAIDRMPPYAAFVTVMTMLGLAGLYYTSAPWHVVSIFAVGVTAVLIAQLGGDSDAR